MFEPTDSQDESEACHLKIIPFKWSLNGELQNAVLSIFLLNKINSYNNITHATLDATLKASTMNTMLNDGSVGLASAILVFYYKYIFELKFCCSCAG